MNANVPSGGGVTSLLYSRLIPIVLLAALVTGSSGAVSDEPPMKPSCEPDTVLENEEVRVWFQGLKGHIKVFDQNRSDPDGGVFTYKTTRMAELRDGEVVAEADLSRALPHLSHCDLRETADGYELVFVAQPPAIEVETGDTLGHPAIRFVYALDHDLQGAKFDIFVNNWPWATGDTELAFDFQVHSPHGFEIAENGVGMRDAEGNERGYMDWAETARVVYEDDREDTSVVESEIEDRTNTLDVRLRYTEVDAGYEDLDYDPWLGTSGYEIAGGRIIGDDHLERSLPPALRPYLDDLPILP